MLLENIIKLENDFLELNERQNNKQMNYDPDKNLQSAFPSSLLIHSHWHSPSGGAQENGLKWSQVIVLLYCYFQDWMFRLVPPHLILFVFYT